MKFIFVSSGVYISMYSDCLDPNRWYHEKSGYIAIIRLTKVPKGEILRHQSYLCVFMFICFDFLNETLAALQGRVRNVGENYTRHFTAPSKGFDCHVSEELHTVSAKTSSFVAFERTQVRIGREPQSTACFLHT